MLAVEENIHSPFKFKQEALGRTNEHEFH